MYTEHDAEITANVLVHYMAVYENSVVSKACCMGGMIRRYVSRYVSEV